MIRSSYLLILAFLSLCIFSCDDSDETPDTVAPEITVVSLEENQKVRGELSFEATAVDLATDVTIKVFVDGILLKEMTGDEITVSLDTRTLVDGPHTIKITATDKDGNTSEKIVNIIVQNTLFKLEVPPGYVDQDAEIYFGLFRNDGTLIALEQAENGAVISVPIPDDFNPDSTFVFVEYFYFDRPATAQGNFGTLVKSVSFYAGINAGEFGLANYTLPPVVGTHELKVTNGPQSNYFALMGGTNLKPTFQSWGMGTVDARFDMSSATSDLYFAVQEWGGVPKYHHLAQVRAGETTQFSCSELEELQSAFVGVKDAQGDYSITVTSESGLAEFSLYNGSSSFVDGKIPVYYPDNIYPQYKFWLNYTSGGYNYFNILHAGVPPTSFRYVDAAATNLNYANRQLKLTTTGTFDLATVGGYTSTYEQDFYYVNGYTVYFPYSINKITIPSTPVELADFGFDSPTNYEFTGVSLHDFTGLSGDSDYQNQIVFSADGIGRGARDQIYFGTGIVPTHSGRKVKSGDNTIPENLKPILRDRLPIAF